MFDRLLNEDREEHTRKVERIRLSDAESRRLWLEDRWRSHLLRVRSAKARRRP